MNVLVIDGHPRSDSYCHSLADAYVEGALNAGHEVEQLTLRQLHFDLNEKGQDLEVDVLSSQQSLLWANHIAIIAPVWWGTMPALLKGWLDRTLRCDFAFTERADGTWEGKLQGKTAQLIFTLDTPQWIYRWLLMAPALHSLREATLGFCGINPAKFMLLGPIRNSDQDHREKWIRQVTKKGQFIDRDFHTGIVVKARAWLQLARPQFYLFPFLAVIAGAMMSSTATGHEFSWSLALAVGIGTLLVEFITVLTNEVHDVATDVKNQNFGLFTGGSRVLVEKRISIQEVLTARLVALLLLAVPALLVYREEPSATPQLTILLLLGLAVGIGYTAPPLKFSYRGLGECAVAVSHSVFVLLAGYFSHGGKWSDHLPWLFILPLGLSIFPSIIFAGFPDYLADKAVNKRTLAVRLGKFRAGLLALLLGVSAALSHVFLTDRFSLVSAIIVAHCFVISYAIIRHLNRPTNGRINGLIFLTLTYMIWFGLEPLIRFWPN